MNCREFEDWILESVDAPIDTPRAALLAEHVSDCDSCRRFQDVQRALDTALVAHCTLGAPRADLSASVRRLAAREKKQALWDSAPELLHLGGGVAGTLLTAWLLPAPPATVIAAGLGFTLLTYLPHALFRGVIETADEP